MKHAGYSLVEILLVITITGILAAVVIPRFGPFIEKIRVKSQAHRLVADIRYTRHLAVTYNEDYRLSVDSTANTYAIYDASGTQVDQIKNIDSDIAISADRDFIFESLGNADFDSDTSILFSVGGYQANITVIVPTGRVNVSGP